MRQKQNCIESAPPKIRCDQIGHENEFISHVCLRDDCEEQRAHCRKCNLIQHRQCAGEIQFMDEITDQIKSIDLVQIKIVNLIEVAMQKFQHILKELNSLRQFIQYYSDVPTLSNLNIVAGILKYYSQKNIEKLLHGQDQLDNLISSYYMPQSLQIAKKKIKNLDQNQSNIKTMSSSVNSSSRITTNINQSSNANIQLNSHPNINPNPSPPSKISSNTDNLDQIDEDCAYQYHLKAQFHYDNRQYAEAVEYFDLATSLNPNIPNSWNNKGTSLNELDRDSESLQCFDKALEIVNSKPQIDREAKLTYLRNKANTLLKLKQFQNSIKTIDEGLALDPLNKHFIRLKITSLTHLNQLAEALKFINEAIQLNSNNYKPHQFKVGMILIRLKKIDQAMDSFCVANSIKPKKQTYFLLGQLLEQECRFDEAESCYQSSLEIDQNYYQARQQLQIVQQYKQFK